MSNYTDLPFEVREEILAAYFVSELADSNGVNMLKCPIFSVNFQMASEAIKVASPIRQHMFQKAAFALLFFTWPDPRTGVTELGISEEDVDPELSREIRQSFSRLFKAEKELLHVQETLGVLGLSRGVLERDCDTAEVEGVEGKEV